MRIALLASLLLACGSGDPPSITALGTPEPAQVVVGEAVQLKVGVGVVDEDANLTELRVKLKSPWWQSVESTIDVAAQAGKARNSTVTLLLEVKPQEAGTFTIEVVAADADGNASAPATVTFTAN